MASSPSHDTNISTQTSGLFRSTSRPGPTQLQGASQPHSIAELAEHAKQSLGDVSRPFAAWLRIAENARRDAKSFYELGDVESAFVEYGKAAIILLEKIPGHPDYRVLPSTTQRQNMGVQGQETLDSLAGLKISIMTRYEQYEQGQAYHSSLKAQAPASNPTQQPAASIPPRSRIPSPNSFENDRPRHEHEEPRQSEEVYPTDGARVEQWQARVDDVRRHRKWEDNGWRQLAEQRRQEQDGILQRQIKAEIAALAVQTAGLGQPIGQDQNHALVSASGTSGPITGYPDAP